MYLSIEGTVGSGKTTVIKSLQKDPRFKAWRFVCEPVQQFNKLDKFNPLTMAYQEPKLNALMSHIHIMTVVSKLYFELVHRDREEHLMVERCHMSPSVFASTHRYLDVFSEFQYQTVKELYDFILLNTPLEIPDYIIFILPSFEVCMNRMTARAREGEKAGSEYFFRILHLFYHNFAKDLLKKYPERVFLIEEEIADQPKQVVTRHIANLIKFLSGEKERQLKNSSKKRKRTGMKSCCAQSPLKGKKQTQQHNVNTSL